MSFKNCHIIGTGVDPEHYHAANTALRGSRDFIISPSSLKQFSECPEEWVETGKRIALLRSNLDASIDRSEREYWRDKIAALEGDSKVQKWGSLVDARLLTPEQFDTRYVVRPDTYLSEVLECPSCGSVTESKQCRKCKCDREIKSVEKPLSARSDECADWVDKQETEGKTIITPDTLADCDFAISRLMSKPIIKRCVEVSDKQVHVSGEWLDRATGLVIPVRCLLDFVPKSDTEFVPDIEPIWPKVIADLKTCMTADIVEFGRRVFRFGWHIQAAFDRDLYVAATGEDRTDWLIIGQKNFGVWQPFKRLLTEDFLTLGASEYQRMLTNYAWCVKNNRWPDHDDTDESICGCGRAAPEPWQSEKAAFAPRFTFEDETEADEEQRSELPS